MDYSLFKYKVGDKIEIVKGSSISLRPLIGYEGVVTEIQFPADHMPIQIQLYDKPRTLWASESDLKLIL